MLSVSYAGYAYSASQTSEALRGGASGANRGHVLAPAFGNFPQMFCVFFSNAFPKIIYSQRSIRKLIGSKLISSWNISVVEVEIEGELDKTY